MFDHGRLFFVLFSFIAEDDTNNDCYYGCDYDYIVCSKSRQIKTKAAKKQLHLSIVLIVDVFQYFAIVYWNNAIGSRFLFGSVSFSYMKKKHQTKRTFFSLNGLYIRRTILFLLCSYKYILRKTQIN